VPDWEISDYFGMGGNGRELQKCLDILLVLVGDSGEKQAGLPNRALLPDVNIFGKRSFCLVGYERIYVFHSFLERFPV
jgi:hypothetical protein